MCTFAVLQSHCHAKQRLLLHVLYLPVAEAWPWPGAGRSRFTVTLVVPCCPGLALMPRAMSHTRQRLSWALAYVVCSCTCRVLLCMSRAAVRVSVTAACVVNRRAYRVSCACRALLHTCIVRCCCTRVHIVRCCTRAHIVCQLCRTTPCCIFHTLLRVCAAVCVCCA